ncbi:MAG: phosphatidate cytidylyltransferase [Chitinophagaceae bacterium]
MKNKLIVSVLLLIMLSVSLTSCEIIGGIFKAGVGVGIFIVVAIIAVIALVIGRAGRK